MIWRVSGDFNALRRCPNRRVTDAAVIVGPAAWGPFGPLLLIGSSATLLERAIAGIRELP